MYAVGFLTQRKKDTSFQHIAHFLACMRGFHTGTPPGSKGHTDGFHLIFLCVWNQPFNLVSKFRIIFQKIIFFPKDNLFRCVICKKFLKAAAETLQDIREGTDGWRGKVSLNLGDESFGKLSPVCQFLLSQSILCPQTFQFCSDVHKNSFKKHTKIPIISHVEGKEPRLTDNRESIVLLNSVFTIIKINYKKKNNICQWKFIKKVLNIFAIHRLKKKRVKSMKKVQKEGKEDELLILFVAILTLAGLFFLYSTGTYNGKVKFGDAGYYLKKQLFASVLGMIAFWVMARIDYHRVAAFATVLYLCSIALSTAVLFVGRSYNGSKRWLALGPLSFQPAEFAKAAVILFLSVRISNRKKKTDSPWFMLRTMAALLPIVGLVGTNNLSTAIIILGIGVILIFVAHPRYLPFLGIGAAGIGFVAIFLSMESYRLERLAIWRDPEKYEKGFQTIQGLYAIGSGGIFGRGMGNSLQKLGFVPEAQNDMIFSIICEETGLFGAILVILLFGGLIWRLMVAAVRAEDLLGELIGAGIMGHIALQVILNIAVVTNTIPNTGITLPFISYGGTSVLFLMGEMGLALSVTRYSRAA